MEAAMLEPKHSHAGAAELWVGSTAPQYFVWRGLPTSNNSIRYHCTNQVKTNM